MHERQHDTTAENKSHPTKKVEAGKEQAPEQKRSPASDYSLLGPVSGRMSSPSLTQSHAIILKKAKGSGSSQASNFLLQLQRQYGNQYVQRVVDLSRKEEDNAVAPEIEQSIQQARGGGQVLDSRVRGQMEPAFGVDFSKVRVHTDAGAHSLNRALNARAFTTGQDIFFNQSEYNPGSSGGRELIAHELTHVVQQRQDRVQPTLLGKDMAINDSPTLENEADVLGKRAAEGKVVNVTSRIQECSQRQVSEKKAQVSAVAYQGSVKTINGRLRLYEEDPVWNDDWANINYTIRLGKATWKEGSATKSAWIVDSSEVLILKTASEFKAAPKIEVKPRIISGALISYIYLSLQVAGPKVTTNFGFKASASIGSTTGVEIGNEAAKANASTSKNLGVELSCGRTTELPGAEVGLRRGVIVKNGLFFGGRITGLVIRNMNEDVGPPRNASMAGLGDWLDGDQEPRVQLSGPLFVFSLLK